MDALQFPCPMCGKPVDEGTAQPGERVVCPHCNGLVNAPKVADAEQAAVNPQAEGGDCAVESSPESAPPEAGEPVTPVEFRARREPWITWLSRVVSLLLHAALLLGLAGVTWLEGRGSSDNGREVSIAEASDAGDIGFDSPELPEMETQVDEAPAQSAGDVDPIGESDLDPATGQGPAAKVLEVLTGVAPPTRSGEGLPDVAPRSGFFGIEERGRRLAYVVDYSGSMYNGVAVLSQIGKTTTYTGVPPKLGAAKRELIRSIKKLSPLHKFIVLFYSNGFQPMPGGRMLRATAANKRRVIDWIEQANSGGGTDPTGAMQHVLGLKPDAVWLLSDGIFAESACGVIKAANRAARARIHTIAFFDNEGEPILRRIARENEGTYRFVSPKSLGLGARNP